MATLFILTNTMNIHNLNNVLLTFNEHNSTWYAYHRDDHIRFWNGQKTVWEVKEEKHTGDWGLAHDALGNLQSRVRLYGMKKRK